MFQSLLAKLAQALEGANIPYMVIGGQAVLLHGEPRLTRGIDITLGLDASVASKVLDIVHAIGLTASVDDVHGFVQKTNVLPLTEASTSLRVDLIFSFTSYESEAIQRAVKVQTGGSAVSFATPEDLIIHKLVAGRPRDLEDVAGILLRHEQLDERYLERWLPVFKTVVHRDLLAEFRTLKKKR
jgi:Nucleotidyltransferase of unknown function (DUF6036)